ncbi:MAG: Lrp/AsnC family transcriptional regulator [Candidatus Thermoplasmatota archaeon]|uniref:Lrp/AsnC family transcriptional regulator n=2 Tax=Candidatus Sysuiplasma superficiale TaxID=2823368 RepID=A0A8J8CFC3_9ARCH|nr:Lrp/AsnC family transcriptional regulator [Candidatus Sysuiplasma superficiale]MCL4346968.1 Lrp/AsnC family transcriptional regulator [Candidatus Thermoplasmatota archaeon]
MDEKDIMILEILQNDARTPLKEIGERVKLAAPTVHERIQAMIKNGVIKGFTTIVEPRKVDLDITAFIMLYFKTGGSLGDEKVIELINEIDDIQECFHLAGDEDLLVKVKTKNMATLENIILRLSRSGHFSRTKSIIALSNVKESTNVNLSHLMERIMKQKEEKERPPVQ